MLLIREPGNREINISGFLDSDFPDQHSKTLRRVFKQPGKACGNLRMGILTPGIYATKLVKERHKKGKIIIPLHVSSCCGGFATRINRLAGMETASTGKCQSHPIDRVTWGELSFAYEQGNPRGDS